MQGNVFKPVCHSVYMWGAILECNWMAQPWTASHAPRGNSPDSNPNRTPPWLTSGQYTSYCFLLYIIISHQSLFLWYFKNVPTCNWMADSPPRQHPVDSQKTLQPWMEPLRLSRTPWTQTNPPVNKQVVHLLLECFLVSFWRSRCFNLLPIF